jgi:hypothetical protein
VFEMLWAGVEFDEISPFGKQTEKAKFRDEPVAVHSDHRKNTPESMGETLDERSTSALPSQNRCT